MTKADPSATDARAQAFITRVCSSPTIPSVPAVAANVLALTKDPDVTFARLATAISADAAMVAKLLRMANSAVFGGQKKIASVNEAVVRMGLKVTRMTVLGFTLESEIAGKVPPEFEADRFWKHSLTTATAARLIAETVWPAKRDDAFSAGLLQDIGMVAIECAAPEAYAEVFAFRREHPTMDLQDIERQILGASHMEVGSALLSGWGLPEDVCSAVAFHHTSQKAREAGLPPEIVRIAQILGLGSDVAKLFHYKTKGISQVAVQQSAELDFGLSEEALQSILTRTEQGVRQTCMLFHLDPSSIPNYAEIRRQATQEVARLAIDLGRDAEIATERAQHHEEELRQLKAEASELQRLASCDELTQLPNRREFLKQLAAETARSRRHGHDLGLLMFDVDHFKKVNDTYGHPVGDQVLSGIGRYLLTESRRSDCVARIGGEEFVALLPESTLEGALTVAEKMRMGIEESSKRWVPGVPGITISVGVAFVRHDSDSLDGAIMLEEADRCLYQAKQAGRNRTRYIDLPDNSRPKET